MMASNYRTAKDVRNAAFTADELAVAADALAHPRRQDSGATEALQRVASKQGINPTDAIIWAFMGRSDEKDDAGKLWMAYRHSHLPHEGDGLYYERRSPYFRPDVEELARRAQVIAAAHIAAIQEGRRSEFNMALLKLENAINEEAMRRLIPVVIAKAEGDAPPTVEDLPAELELPAGFDS
jgi:hypothetical protein